MKEQQLRTINDRKVLSRKFDPAAPPVLIADDSEADIYFLLRAFDQSAVRNRVFVTRSGKETLGFLKGLPPFHDRIQFPFPLVVLLDLYMPGVNGFDILKWKCTRPEYERTLFIALTNSSSIRDISRAYDRGANTFLNKPLDGEELKQLLESYQAYWTFRSQTQAVHVKTLQ